MAAALIALRNAVLARTARAQTVAVTLGVDPPAPDVPAVRYDRSADPAFEDGTFRRVRFEIAFDALAGEPGKGDVIDDGTNEWRVEEIEERPEVGTWILSVEKSDG